MSIVVSGFALINIAMYIVLPMEVIREKNTVTVVGDISYLSRRFGGTAIAPQPTSSPGII